MKTMQAQQTEARRRRKAEVLGLKDAIERVRSWGYSIRYEGQDPLRYQVVTPRAASCIRRFHEIEHFARTGRDEYLERHA